MKTFSILMTLLIVGLVSQSFAASTPTRTFCHSKYDFAVIPGGEVNPSSSAEEICNATRNVDLLLETREREFLFCYKKEVVTQPLLGRTSPVVVPVIMGWSKGKMSLMYRVTRQTSQNFTLSPEDNLRVCVENAIEKIKVPVELRSTVFSGYVRFSQ